MHERYFEQKWPNVSAIIVRYHHQANMLGKRERILAIKLPIKMRAKMPILGI